VSDDYKLVKHDIRTPGGALAYTRGQLIHADAVKDNGWDENVIGRDTQEARTILADITGDVVDDPKQTRSTRAAASSTTSSTEE
jgi:hypothetical protein